MIPCKPIWTICTCVPPRFLVSHSVPAALVHSMRQDPRPAGRRPLRPAHRIMAQRSLRQLPQVITAPGHGRPSLLAVRPLRLSSPDSVLSFPCCCRWGFIISFLIILLVFCYYHIYDYNNNINYHDHHHFLDYFVVKLLSLSLFSLCTIYNACGI